MKNYKLIEKGADFWGRKRFEIEEDNSSNKGSAFGYLLIALLLLLIFTIPSGIIALPIYVSISLVLRILKIRINQDLKESISWIVTFFSILFVLGFLYYSFDKENYYFNFPIKELNSIKWVVVLNIIGGLSYNILYRITCWGSYEKSKKISLRLKYLKFLIIITVILILYYTQDIDFRRRFAFFIDPILTLFYGQ